MNAIEFDKQTFFPSKIVCVGRNYSAHIKELNNEVPDQAVIFIKPNSAISNTLWIPQGDRLSYESEISFLINNGRPIAVAFGLDLTKREVQNELKAKGLPWERAKAFNGAAVFSNFVAIPGSLDKLRIELEINGQIVQQGKVYQMINTPDSLLIDIQGFMSLENGDILMTGTPSGVGLINKDDVFVGRIFDDKRLLIEKQWQVIQAN